MEDADTGLTWHHDTPAATVELFRRHIQENNDHPERTFIQLQDAVTDWRALEQEFSNVTVREYRSLPTMQGIIVYGRWACIELQSKSAHSTP